MLKKMTELVADILNYLPWGEISRTTANEVAAHLLENDVVPVVRCKDCWKSAEGLCSYQFKDVPGKDFCGDGERIER